MPTSDDRALCWVNEYGGHVYVITRSDLSPRQQLVQTNHASIEAVRNGLISTHSAHPHLVLCSVPNEQELNELTYKLQNKKIGFSIFTEPDLNNQITAIATEPLTGNRRNPLRNLPLIGE